MPAAPTNETTKDRNGGMLTDFAGNRKRKLARIKPLTGAASLPPLLS
jgi:hypothetical protein